MKALGEVGGESFVNGRTGYIPNLGDVAGVL